MDGYQLIVLWQLYDVIINLARGSNAFTVDDKTKRSGMAAWIWVAKLLWVLGGVLFIF